MTDVTEWKKQFCWWCMGPQSILDVVEHGCQLSMGLQGWDQGQAHTRICPNVLCHHSGQE